MILLLLLLTGASASAVERMEVPGGSLGIRQVTGLPSHIPDHMLLNEAVRVWYSARQPLQDKAGVLYRLAEHLRTSAAPVGPGPVLPLDHATWRDLLGVQHDSEIAPALVLNRSAMLLYHGLMGMEPGTRQWMGGQRDLLKDLLRRGSEAFASTAPSMRVTGGQLLVPGGAPVAAAWGSVVGAEPSNPAEFIRRLVGNHGGRIAWAFSVLESLDASRLAFAVGPTGEHLPDLLRHFVSASPEWDMTERPFWRPSFDPSWPLRLLRPSGGQVLGTAGFWREVFRTESLEDWRIGLSTDPLNGATLVNILFAQPHRARDRWTVFALGQRILAASHGTRVPGLAIRGAWRMPSLAIALERSRVRDLELQVRLYRAAARVTMSDSTGGKGHLGPWQAAVAIVEHATITGGFTPDEAREVLAGLADLPLKQPREEIVAWVLESLVPALSGRPGAPSSADATLLQTISGALTSSGPPKTRAFRWEDLEYVFVPHRVAWRRMEEVRAAQGGPTLDDALVAWRSESRSDRSRAEEIVSRLLPALAYAPHQAVADEPTLGADVPFRHEFFGPTEVHDPSGRRAWEVARGGLHGTAWHLEGSMLALDLALVDWYVNRHGPPPASPPTLDEPDTKVLALAGLAAATFSPAELQFPEALASLRNGREAAEALEAKGSLIAALDAADVDPWRQQALRLQPTLTHDDLTLAEQWRLGGGPGLLVSSWPFDGCPCLREPSRAAVLWEGRRASGVIGATVPDLALRVLQFLAERQLPLELTGEMMLSAYVDLVHGAQSARPDDRHALATAASSLDDARLEEHLLALIGDGLLAKP